jgi:hypothetical protein
MVLSKPLTKQGSLSMPIHPCGLYTEKHQYTLDCVIEGGMPDGIAKTAKGDTRLTGTRQMPKKPERTDECCKD